MLSWSRLDIEQRMGFNGGRFTQVNGILSFILGSTISLAFYGAVHIFRQQPWAETFLARGPTPYVVVFFTGWSLAILLLKWSKLRLQRKALTLDIIPGDQSFVLSPTTAPSVIERTYSLVDDPRRFLLVDRIHIALANIKNLGRVTDVDDILRAQAERDESALETSYTLLRGFVWAIPVLGFIGTVMGLSQAIGSFSGVLGNVDDVQQITSSLTLVTGGLSTAFETTLVALVAALALQMLITFLFKSEEEFLDECSDYCVRKVVSRVRVLPYQVEVEADETPASS